MPSQDPWAALPDAAPADPWAALPDATPATKPHVPPSAQIAMNLAGPTGVGIWSKLPKWLQGAADVVAAPAMRVVPAIGGSIVGGVIGGPPGALIGGGIGSGLGEAQAEAMEVQTGQREQMNPIQIGATTALGLVPVVGGAKGSVLKTAATRAVQGGLLGGVGAGATEMAETGELPSARTLATGGVVGTLLGGPLGAIEGRLASRAASAAAGAADQPAVTTATTAAATDAWAALPDAPAGGALPENLGPAAYAGPERRTAPRQAGPQAAADDARYTRIREKLAAGEQPGTPELRAVGQQQSELNAAREAAAKAREEGPVLPARETAEAADAGRLLAAPGPEDVERGRRPSLVDAEREAVLSGEQVPAQRPLSAERIRGEQVFISKQPEHVREGLASVLERNRHFEAQRRGVQPMDRTNAIARHLQVERQKVLPKGQALNAEELQAYSNAVATTSDRIETLGQKVKDGTATLMDEASMAQAVLDQGNLLTSLMGARGEAGRALNMLKSFAQVFESRDVEAIRKAMKMTGIDLPAVVKKLGELKTDAEKLDYLRSLQKHTLWDKARAVYFSNILSGPRTHIRNLLGNTVNAAFTNASKVAAVGYDIAESKLTGRARSIYFSEIPSAAAGSVAGVKQGIDDFVFTLKHGYTRNALDTFDVPRPELGGGGKNPFNWTGRLLEAEDQFFYGVNYNTELFSRLHAKARSQGLVGEALEAQVAKWKIAPPKDVKAAAESAARRAVFKEEPGAFVRGLINLKKTSKLGQAMDFVMPFVKTPANILRQGIEATPLAPLTKQTRTALAAGGRERAEAVGRMATGTVALAALAWWAAQGKISGTGPTDPEERAALMESGWRPNSVKVGDTWVSFDQFQPIAVPLYAVAEAYEQFRRDRKPPSPVELTGRVASAVLDQSFYSGLSDFNNAMSDPDRYAQRFVQRLAQGAVPFSGLSRNVANAVDTTVREPQNEAEAVKAILPGVSKSVQPKLDRMGNEVKRAGGAATQLTPFNIGTPSSNPVIQELTRLKVDSLGVPPKSLPATSRLPKIELTIDQRKEMGHAVEVELQRLFQHPRWKDLGEDVQLKRIKQAASRGRERVANRIHREWAKANGSSAAR